MGYRSFVYEVDDGVATVRLNDPDRLNALTFQTYAELERLTRELAADDAVQVLLLTGNGSSEKTSSAAPAMIFSLSAVIRSSSLMAGPREVLIK